MIRIPQHFQELSPNETQAHSYRVAYLAELTAAYLNYPKEIQCRLFEGGVLHDIGKQAIDPAILYKNTPLTEDELRLVKSHVELSSLEIPIDWLHPDVQAMIMQHHERCDGSGYPLGLREDQIHTLAHLIALCDVFDAMTSKRCYQTPRTVEKVLTYLTSQAGIQFQVDLTLKFCDFIRTLPEEAFE